MLKQLDEDIEFVVLLKARRECFQPYIYFIDDDTLITTREIYFYDPDSRSPNRVKYALYLIISMILVL